MMCFLMRKKGVWHSAIVLLFWALITGLIYILYNSTFSSKGGFITESGRVYSDFLSHIPLIRYFRFNSTLNIEYPLWLGEPIKYHFLFYMIAGYLERLGLSISTSLNLLSTVGLTLFLICIYKLGVYITGSKKAASLAVVLFFFNPSFSWFYPIKEYGLTPSVLEETMRSPDFFAYGPWKDTIVSAFQTLNTYVNQRHLPLSFAFVILALACLFYTDRGRYKILGLILCLLLPLLNRAAIPIFSACVFILAVYKVRNTRSFIWSALFVVAIFPGLFYLGRGTEIRPQIKVGYLYQTPSYKEVGLTEFSKPIKWVVYWIFNLGVLPLLALYGAAQIKRREGLLSDKLAWFLITFALFVAVNIFQISVEMAGQHKLVNFIIAVANIYAATAIVSWFEKHPISYKALATISLAVLVLGGMVDLFPILNSYTVKIPDIQRDTTASWIVNNTRPDDNFLNLTYSTMPVSLTGRKIYYGWPYFTWGNGYNITERESFIKNFLLKNVDINSACKEIIARKIGYIYVDGPSFMDIAVDQKYLEHTFRTAYKNDNGQIVIYSTLSACYNQASFAL